MTDFLTVVDAVSRGLEAIAIVFVLGGLVFALTQWVTASLNSRFLEGYWTMKTTFGRALLFGLEILLAADIIRTVAIEPTLESLGALALLVAIRTLLSWTIGVEIDGYWPWQRAQYELQTKAACEDDANA